MWQVPAYNFIVTRHFILQPRIFRASDDASPSIDQRLLRRFQTFNTLDSFCCIIRALSFPTRLETCHANFEISQSSPMLTMVKQPLLMPCLSNLAHLVNVNRRQSVPWIPTILSGSVALLFLRKTHQLTGKITQSISSIPPAMRILAGR